MKFCNFDIRCDSFVIPMFKDRDLETDYIEVISANIYFITDTSKTSFSVSVNNTQNISNVLSIKNQIIRSNTIESQILILDMTIVPSTINKGL